MLKRSVTWYLNSHGKPCIPNLSASMESPDIESHLLLCPLPERNRPKFTPQNNRCSFIPQSGTIYALLSSPQVAVPSAPTVSGSGICVPPGIYCPGLEKGSPPAQRSCGSAESPCGEKRDTHTSWLCIYREELFVKK